MSYARSQPLRTSTDRNSGYPQPNRLPLAICDAGHVMSLAGLTGVRPQNPQGISTSAFEINTGTGFKSEP